MSTSTTRKNQSPSAVELSHIQEIKSYLARHFPDTVFTITIKRFHPGVNCLDMTWSDGPYADGEEMKRFSELFRGADLDKDGVMVRRETIIMDSKGELISTQLPFDFILKKRTLTLPEIEGCTWG